MPTKPPKSWLEIQMAIAAVSITATMSFWNVFAASDHQKALTQAKQATLPPPPPTPTETETAVPLPTPTVGLVPVKIIFGGTPPKHQVVQVAAPQAPKKNKGGGNNGGGGNSGSVSAPAAPAPVVNTGSSKP